MCQHKKQHITYNDKQTSFTVKMCTKEEIKDQNVKVNSQRSMMWFLQIAQLSTTMSQAQSATAFH